MADRVQLTSRDKNYVYSSHNNLQERPLDDLPGATLGGGKGEPGAPVNVDGEESSGDGWLARNKKANQSDELTIV